MGRRTCKTSLRTCREVVPVAKQFWGAECLGSTDVSFVFLSVTFSDRFLEDTFSFSISRRLDLKTKIWVSVFACKTSPRQTTTDIMHRAPIEYWEEWQTIQVQLTLVPQNLEI